MVERGEGAAACLEHQGAFSLVLEDVSLHVAFVYQVADNADALIYVLIAASELNSPLDHLHLDFVASDN